MARVPTKEELKLRYGIADEDFEILTNVKAPNGTFAERLTDFEGHMVWLLRSRFGKIVAVWLVLSIASKTFREAPDTISDVSDAVNSWTDTYHETRNRPAPVADNWAPPLVAYLSNNAPTSVSGYIPQSGPLPLSNGSSNWAPQTSVGHKIYSFSMAAEFPTENGNNMALGVAWAPTPEDARSLVLKEADAQGIKILFFEDGFTAVEEATGLFAREMAAAVEKPSRCVIAPFQGTPHRPVV